MNTNSVPANSATRPRIVSKITRADMGLALPRLDDKCLNEDGSTDMARLAKRNALIEQYKYVYDLGGLIRRTKPVKGKGDQDGIQFLGEFKAHTAPQLPPGIADIWFIAGRAHVPKMYEDVLYAGLVNAQEAEPGATLKFLIRVGIKPPTSDKPSITGYEWTVQTLVDTDAAESPVDLLFSTAAPLQLQGPTGGFATDGIAGTGASDPATGSTPPATEESRHSRRKAS